MGNFYSVLYAPFPHPEKDDGIAFSAYDQTYEQLQILVQEANNTGGNVSHLFLEKFRKEDHCNLSKLAGRVRDCRAEKVILIIHGHGSEVRAYLGNQGGTEDIGEDIHHEDFANSLKKLPRRKQVCAVIFHVCGSSPILSHLPLARPNGQYKFCAGAYDTISLQDITSFNSLFFSTLKDHYLPDNTIDFGLVGQHMENYPATTDRGMGKYKLWFGIQTPGRIKKIDRISKGEESINVDNLNGYTRRLRDALDKDHFLGKKSFRESRVIRAIDGHLKKIEKNYKEFALTNLKPESKIFRLEKVDSPSMRHMKNFGRLVVQRNLLVENLLRLITEKAGLGIRIENGLDWIDEVFAREFYNEDNKIEVYTKRIREIYDSVSAGSSLRIDLPDENLSEVYRYLNKIGFENERIRTEWETLIYDQIEYLEDIESIKTNSFATELPWNQERHFDKSELNKYCATKSKNMLTEDALVNLENNILSIVTSYISVAKERFIDKKFW